MLRLAACWAHTRRKFYDVFQSTGSPIAEEALRRIRDIYLIEADIRGRSPPFRLAERRQRTKPLVDSFRLWLDRQLPLIPGRSNLAEAIRPVSLGRKNHLFAGSDRGGDRWAIVCSLVETCKLNSVEPYAYLADVLQRMVGGHPVNRLDELLPWNWKAGNPVKN